MIRLICYAQRIHFSIQCYRRAHDARPHCQLKLLFSGTPADTCIIFILPETRVYMKAAVALVYLYLLLRNSFRKPRKGVQNER